MKLSEFILLDEEEKKSSVLHQGVLIAKRNQDDCMVFLFQLDFFYVETWCNVENKAVEEFRIFNNVGALRPYLDAIPLGDLLN
jgi:hypothetical protein